MKVLLVVIVPQVMLDLEVRPIFVGLLTLSSTKGSQTCVSCKESKLYYLMFGGYLLIQVIAICLSVR